MTRSITGLTALPSAGLVAPVETVKLHTPTLVLSVNTPIAGFRSPGPLSPMVITGSTPSLIDKDAPTVPRAIPATPTIDKNTTTLLNTLFISTLFPLLTIPFSNPRQLEPVVLLQQSAEV